MPSSASSNRYAPLSEREDVRIEMEELQQRQQATLPDRQDSTREAFAFSATLPPPLRLETKPHSRRRSWPVFTVRKVVDEHGKLHEELQKPRVAPIPEPKPSERPPPVKMIDCRCTFIIILKTIQAMGKSPQQGQTNESQAEGIQTGLADDAIPTVKVCL